MEPQPTEVTQMLKAWQNGDQTALETLIPVVYAELHQLAKGYMAQQSPGHTLQATALVNEAYMRLVRQQHVDWQGRAHFFAVCAKIMRGIAVDHFRRHRQSSLDETAYASPERDVDLEALDEALTKLSAFDPRKSQIVELRFFGGLTEEEVATVLNVAAITVKREWRRARAWLFHALSDNHDLTQIVGRTAG